MRTCLTLWRSRACRRRAHASPPATRAPRGSALVRSAAVGGCQTSRQELRDGFEFEAAQSLAPAGRPAAPTRREPVLRRRSGQAIRTERHREAAHQKGRHRSRPAAPHAGREAQRPPRRRREDGRRGGGVGRRRRDRGRRRGRDGARARRRRRVRGGRRRRPGRGGGARRRRAAGDRGRPRRRGRRRVGRRRRGRRRRRRRRVRAARVQRTARGPLGAAAARRVGGRHAPTAAPRAARGRDRGKRGGRLTAQTSRGGEPQTPQAFAKDRAAGRRAGGRVVQAVDASTGKSEPALLLRGVARPVRRARGRRQGASGARAAPAEGGRRVARDPRGAARRHGAGARGLRLVAASERNAAAAPRARALDRGFLASFA